jgi:hypothetical protein
MRIVRHAGRQSGWGPSRNWRGPLFLGLAVGIWSAVACHTAASPSVAAVVIADDDDGDLARKADIMHGPHWQRAIAELGGWLSRRGRAYSPSGPQPVGRRPRQPLRPRRLACAQLRPTRRIGRGAARRRFRMSSGGRP